MKNWDKILDDFAHKCGDGGPDMTNPRHLALLRESLLKFGWKEFATNEFIGNLREGEEKDYKGKGTRSGSGTKSDPYKYDYSEPSSKTDGESEEGEGNPEHEEWKKNNPGKTLPDTSLPDSDYFNSDGSLRVSGPAPALEGPQTEGSHLPLQNGRRQELCSPRYATNGRVHRSSRRRRQTRRVGQSSLRSIGWPAT